MKQTNSITMANSDAVGYFEGALTKRLKPGASLKAGMLVSFAEDEQFVIPAPAKSLPWGIALRDATALDDKTYVTIQPISGAGQTSRVLISDGIKAGEMLSFDKDGYSKKCADGNNAIGIALTSGQKGDRIEAITTIPFNLKGDE